MPRIQARETLAFLASLGTLLAKDEDRRTALSALAHTAFPTREDDDTLATILESISRS